MNQLEARNSFPLINTLSTKREQLELASIDIDVLRVQTGSQDVQLADTAARLLRTKWDLDPVQDAQNAKSIDIREQLDSYSANERKAMFRNLVAIQLTEGCNGNCPFCLFGTKTGVTAKYSFESLSALFDENANVMSENPFLLYWDSDPFDYRDGDKRFVDVYKLYRQTMPRSSQYISTAMPRGGEDDFINFMLYVAFEVKDEGAAYYHVVPVRLSLTKQSIQRVEATLVAMTNRLLERGYTQEDINTLYGKVISTVGRFDNFLLPIGPYIKKADDIKNTFSTACRDGVVLSPGSAHAIMMTAATIYEPSGQTEIELKPGKTEMFIPMKIREELHAKFPFGEKSLFQRTQQKQTMLPMIKHADGREFTLPDAFDNMILQSGREVASLSRLIANFARLEGLPVHVPDALREKATFIRVSTEVFRERQNYTRALIQSMQQFCANGALPAEKRRQMEYYILLTQSHLAKMDFLAFHAEQGQSVDVISKMAIVLTEVGRRDLDKLPAILSALSGPDVHTSVKIDPLEKGPARAFIDRISR